MTVLKTVLPYMLQVALIDFFAHCLDYVRSTLNEIYSQLYLHFCDTVQTGLEGRRRGQGSEARGFLLNLGNTPNKCAQRAIQTDSQIVHKQNKRSQQHTSPPSQVSHLSPVSWRLYPISPCQLLL